MPELKIQVHIDGWCSEEWSMELFDLDSAADAFLNLAELIQRERIIRLITVEVG